MRKFLILLFITFLFFSCAPKTTPDVDIDISPRVGKAPLEVVGYIFFNVDYSCAEVEWSYWYGEFESTRNISKEEVCNAKVATHQFGFITPGRVTILISAKLNGKKYSRAFNVIVSE